MGRMFRLKKRMFYNFNVLFVLSNSNLHLDKIYSKNKTFILN